MGILSALIGWLGYHLGIRGLDTASATGSLHSKIMDVKNTLSILGDSADARADNTVMGWLASPIKSIQRGTIAITADSQTATISSVDTGKAKINYLGCTTAYTVANGITIDFTDIMPRLSLYDSTRVKADRAGHSSGTTLTVSYEVIEYY